MATSLLFFLPSAPETFDNNAGSSSSTCISLKSSFLYNIHFIYAPRSTNLRNNTTVRGRNWSSPTVVKAGKSLDNIPKQFRGENLKDGLMKNFENVPSSLFGLSPSQMELFMAENSPVNQLVGKVPPESLSSMYHYMNKHGMHRLESGEYRATDAMSQSVIHESDYDEEAPDLPSYLLNARIVYLGLPIVPAVAELLIAQFLWLEFNNNTEPIFLYVNSTGLQNEKRELVGSNEDAFSIADIMCLLRTDLHTVNVSRAFGHAAMLLSLGNKGKRWLMPRSFTLLNLPPVPKLTGSSTEMWIRAKDLDEGKDVYLEFLEKGTGKPKEVIYEDIKGAKSFTAEKAIEYGIADKIIRRGDQIWSKRTNSNWQLDVYQKKAASVPHGS